LLEKKAIKWVVKCEDWEIYLGLKSILLEIRYCIS
jgi:hypothetical protein